MNNYLAHAFVAQRERVWENEKKLPPWQSPRSTNRTHSHRFLRPLAVLLIAGTTAFGVFGPHPGSAHTLPRCFDMVLSYQLSMRQPDPRHHRMIPAQPLFKWFCGLQPTDPGRPYLVDVEYLTV